MILQEKKFSADDSISEKHWLVPQKGLSAWCG